MQLERYLVLVIDDDEVDRENVRRLFGDEVDLLEAASASEGRRLLGEHRPDCVLIDYRLPDADGLELLDDIAREHPLSAPLFLTGEGDEGIAVRAMKTGALDYLVKGDLTPESLWVSVRGAIHRKRMEAAVREQEAMFRAFCEQVEGVVWMRDPATFKLRYVNTRVDEVFGRPVEAFIGDSDAWTRAVHPDDRGRVFRDLETRVGDGTVDQEYRIVRPDGAIRRVWDRSFPLHDGRGDVSVYAGIAVDITEIRRAEEERRKTDERFEWAINGANDGLWYWDMTNDEIWWSPRFYELLGLDPSSFTPSHDAWLALNHPDDVATVETALREHLEQGKPFDVETRLRVAGRGYRWFSGRGAVIRNEEGTPVHMAGSFMDVTERRDLEAQLRHALKMDAIGRLAGGVAHDFNNLLMVINGHAELGLIELPDDHPLRADLEQIRQAGDRAADLTRQLLAFSRKDITRPEVLNLNVSIEQSMKMLSRLISENVRLEAVLAPDLRNVRIDPSHVDQILVNLVVNSRDAMPDGGTLVVETANVAAHAVDDEVGNAVAREWVALTVRDTGCGMDPETLDHALEPFFTTKGPHQGTGLGLATVYGVARQAGGDLEIESEIGEGTEVRVLLPAVPDAVDGKGGDDGVCDARGDETVLLVEDTKHVRGLVHRVLTEHGYRVLEAANGERALEVADAFQGRIDLLLTDVVMPGLNGPDVAARLCDRRPETHVLYMSGYVEDDIPGSAVSSDSKEFLQKPATPSSILRRVRDVLDGRRAGGGARLAPGPAS